MARIEKMGERREAELTAEMKLEMLVDGELPEVERGEMLRSLDRAPEGWRELGIRFLERQVERQTVRGLMEAGDVTRKVEAEKGLPVAYAIGRWAGQNRQSLAAMVVMGALCVAGGIWYGTPGKSGGGEVASGAETIKTMLPAVAMAGAGDSKPMEVSVQLQPGEMPEGYSMPANGAGEGRHDVVIVPHGKDRAVIFPVTMVRPAKIY